MPTALDELTSRLKHSRAKNVQVSLRATGDAIVLRVQDDGMGMGRDRGTGLGLRIMRNRASVIGARLTVEPVQPHGTLIACTLPSTKFSFEGHA